MTERVRVVLCTETMPAIVSSYSVFELHSDVYRNKDTYLWNRAANFELLIFLLFLFFFAAARMRWQLPPTYVYFDRHRFKIEPRFKRCLQNFCRDAQRRARYVCDNYELHLVAPMHCRPY